MSPMVTATLINGTSGATTITSSSVPCPGKTGRLSIETVTTGTLTGTFTLEISHDGGTSFLTYSSASASFTNPAGATSSGIANFENVPGTHWRLKYTASSGAGNVTAKLVQSDIF